MTKLPWACGAITLLVSLLAVSDTVRSHVVAWLFFHIPGLAFGPHRSIDSLLFLNSLRSPIAPPRDTAERLCELAAVFRNHGKSFTVLTAENVERFKASCLKVLPTLEPERRATLEIRMAAGIGSPWMVEATTEVPQMPVGAFKKDYASCAAGAARMEERELEGEALVVFDNTGLLPLKARHVVPHEIADALKRSEVVTFDGRSLLPERVFNTTVGHLQELHQDRDVWVHPTTNLDAKGFQRDECHNGLKAFSHLASAGGSDRLLYWLLKHGMYKVIMANMCNRFLTLREVASLMPRFSRANWHFGYPEANHIQMVKEVWGNPARPTLAGTNINVLRLPNWHRGELDAKKLLAKVGLEGESDYAHNILWLGVSPGGFHADIQDNILVQLHGVSYALIVPANCSFNVPENEFTLGQQVTAEWFKSKGRDFPFWVVTLRPGDGVVIPSNSLHSVMSREPDRIGMNFFAEPSGKGKMQWPWAPANFFNYANEGHLAMRDLWIKTAVHLWEQKRPDELPYLMQGERQELL